MKKRILSSLILVVFIASFLSFDLLKVKDTFADGLTLPSPSTIVGLSKAKEALTLKGINVNPENLLDVSFYFDGKSKNMEKDAQLLVEYFLTALTFDGEDLWVNLSPYEKDRVLQEDLAATQLGKVLLKQDYILKQLSASLTNPDTKLGKEYWNEVNTSFNKIWIAPNKAEVAVDGDLALLKEASLKVLTEEDYLAMQKNSVISQSKNKIFTSKILPLIEKDVNQGENFAQLRQVYSALILGFWFKQKYFSTLYSHYIDNAKVKGIDTSDPALKQKVFNLYAESFDKGVYNTIIKEKNDKGSIEKRNYFSGGIQPVPPAIFSSSLNPVDFSSLKAKSATGSLKPLFFNAPVIRTILICALILVAPFSGDFSKAFAQNNSQIELRQTRQSQEIDDLMSVAKDVTVDEATRLANLEKIYNTFMENPDVDYFNDLKYIFENDSGVDLREKTLACLIYLPLNASMDYIYDYVKSKTEIGIDNLDETELKVIRHAVYYLGYSANTLYLNGIWFDKDISASLLFDLVDPSKVADAQTRGKAYAGLGRLLDSGDEVYIQNIESRIQTEPHSVTKMLAEQARDNIKARPIKVLLKNFVVYGDAASMATPDVLNGVLDAGQNVGNEYFIPRQLEALDSVIAGEYEAHLIGDKGQFDQTSLEVLEAAYDTLDMSFAKRMPRASVAEEDSVKQRMAKAIYEVKVRLGIVSVSNSVIQNQKPTRNISTIKGIAGELNLNQEITQPTLIRIYSINGRVLRSRTVGAGFNLSNLKFNGIASQFITIQLISLNGPLSNNQSPVNNTNLPNASQIASTVMARRDEGLSEEEIETEDEFIVEEEDDGPILFAHEDYVKEDGAIDVSAMVAGFFDRLDAAQEEGKIEEIAAVSTKNVLTVAASLDEGKKTLESYMTPAQRMRDAQALKADNLTDYMIHPDTEKYIEKEIQSSAVDEADGVYIDKKYLNENGQIKNADFVNDMIKRLNDSLSKADQGINVNPGIGNFINTGEQLAKDPTNPLNKSGRLVAVVSTSKTSVSTTTTSGGIDMNLNVEVSSSALKEKLYSTMSSDQIREHRARGQLLEGFTFELKIKKGTLTINDIIAQKR